MVVAGTKQVRHLASGDIGGRRRSGKVQLIFSDRIARMQEIYGSLNKAGSWPLLQAVSVENNEIGTEDIVFIICEHHPLPLWKISAYISNNTVQFKLTGMQQ